MNTTIVTMIFIFAIVFTVVLTICVTYYKTHSRSQKDEELLSNVIVRLEHMEHEIKLNNQFIDALSRIKDIDKNE